MQNSPPKHSKIYTDQTYGSFYRDPNKVSVIMTNHNCENLLERAIKSILNQTYTNIELLIIDDSSTDKSLGVITNLALTDDRIRVFRNLERKGTYWSKNSVISKTTGSFITMVDSDDYDLPIKIETQLKEFENPKIVCVTCNNERKVSEFSEQTEKVSLGYISMMFKYKVFQEIGYYDTVNFGADSEFYDRVILKYGKESVKHINQVLQISPRRTKGLTTLIPEGSLPRKKYLTNYQSWHKTLKNFYVGFPIKERPFVVDPQSEVKYSNLSNSVVVKTTSTRILPVIMCVWKRTEGFEKIIEQLNQQTFKDFKLFVWNNNPELKDEFSKILNKANFNYEIYHSDKNIGGFARFFYAKRIRRNPNMMDYCVFIDDDQEFGPEILDVFLSEARPNTILSQWGWEFKKMQYYGEDARTERNPGQSLHYAGTGGMVVDMRVFDDDGLFECPSEYWFVEDLWLSFYANHYLKYELIKSSVRMKNGDDVHSLYKVVKDVKKPMLVDLVSNYKWNIFNDYETKVVDEIIVNVIKPNEETQTPTIEIVKPELTKKQINYDKINSIFQISNPKVILQQQTKQETGNLKLNSETFAKIQRPKKRLR